MKYEAYLRYTIDLDDDCYDISDAYQWIRDLVLSQELQFEECLTKETLEIVTDSVRPLLDEKLS